MKRSPLNKKSSKKILRDQAGRLHRELLMVKRQNNHQCEICGKWVDNLGRFHIVRVGDRAKLEFVDDNVLLTCWMPCHYSWHHNGANHPINARTEAKIKELRGPDYYARLIKMSDMIGKHDELYLRARIQELYSELESVNP